MARGRKKDLTIPPTRTLVQQRDYRARRAQHITNLEERCRKAEEENVQLRKELAEARERLVNPAVLWPETVGSLTYVPFDLTNTLTQATASSELLNHLSSARDALVKFNRLIFPNTQSSVEATSPHLNHTLSSNYHSDPTTPRSLGLHNDTNQRSRKELYVDDAYPFTSPSTPTTAIFEVPSLSSGECCGGIIDCDELCGDEDNQTTNITLTRTSDVRSTSA